MRSRYIFQRPYLSKYNVPYQERGGKVKQYSSIIKKLNNTIVHPDGTIDSFEKQLSDLYYGTYDVTKPLIVSPDSSCLGYLGIDVRKPLTMRVKTAWKLREIHHLQHSFTGQCPELLKNSVLAFDSLTQPTSRVIVLDACNEDGDPYIAICRTDRKMNMIEVNEITSLYDKQNFEMFLTKTFHHNKTFFKNRKTELYTKSHRLQLPKEMIIALSNSYFRHTFTKSQVTRALSAFHGQKKDLDQTIQSAASRKSREVPIVEPLLRPPDR